MKDNRYSRRDFLKFAGGVAGTAAVAGHVSISGAASSSPAKATVSVASGPSPASNVKRAVTAVGGIRSFVSKGDVVVVKPNIGWDRKPEQAANTDPEVVAAMVELCLSAGAKEVRIFDNTCNDPRRCYASSGIESAVTALAKKMNASDAVKIYHVDNRKFVRTSIPGATVLKEWEFHRDVLDADRIINVPVAKHHSLAGVTLGLKNMMGVIGGNRGQIHAKLPECLTDIHRRVRAHLTVIDATRVLLRNGPTGGNLDDVKKFDKVFASADTAAADVVVAERIFALVADKVPHIRKALESGLWVSSPSQIRIVES